MVQIVDQIEDGIVREDGFILNCLEVSLLESCVGAPWRRRISQLLPWKVIQLVSYGNQSVRTGLEFIRLGRPEWGSHRIKAIVIPPKHATKVRQRGASSNYCNQDAYSKSVINIYSRYLPRPLYQGGAFATSEGALVLRNWRACTRQNGRNTWKLCCQPGYVRIAMHCRGCSCLLSGIYADLMHVCLYNACCIPSFLCVAWSLTS